MNTSLPDFALRRPITVVMCVITVLGLGLIAFNRTPIEFLPEFNSPFMGVFIPYPGATPAQVEKEVTIPAEGEFRTIPGVRQIFSRSNSDGSFVGMLLDWRTDMGTATAEVRDRMERLKLVLPSEIERMFIQRDSSDNLPVMIVTLYSGEKREAFVENVRQSLQPKLKRIDGVANVEIQGPEELMVMVEFDQHALRRHQLGLYDVMASLQTSSFNMSVGHLTEGRTKYYVRIHDEFTRPEELSNLIVGPNGLMLKDVAEVGYGTQERNFYHAIDGQSRVMLMISKDSESNTVATCRAVRAQLDAMNAIPEFEDAEYSVFFDQSEIIMGAINGLLNAGKFGGLMALVVLFLFLRRFRPTVIVALAIPSSMVVAFVFMFFSGMSLNLITMMSLIVSIGMLVDNSIVVIENVFRRRALGDSPNDAALNGANEVALAVTASTLTTAVVFVPVFYVQAGELSTYMRQFALPVCVALFGSLVIALTVIPLAASRLKPRTEIALYRWLDRLSNRPSGPIGFFAGISSKLRPFERIYSAYATVLRLSIRWRLATLAAIAGIWIATIAIPMKNVGVRGMPDMDLRQVSIEVRMDQNFDMDMARETIARLEDYINGYRDELQIKNVFVFHGPTNGNIDLFLKRIVDLPEGETPRYTSSQVLDILSEKIPERMPGVRVQFSAGDREMGAGDAGGRSGTISVRMRGDDLNELNRYSEEFSALLEDVPGIGKVTTNTSDPQKEIRLSVDDTRAAMLGISPRVVAQTVSFALQGTGSVPDINQRGREIPVWTQFRESDRKKRSNLEQVALVTSEGDLAPVRQIASFSKADSPQAIVRINGKNYVWLSARVSPGNLSTVMRDIQDLAANFHLPTGYEINMGDRLIELQENVGSFGTAFLLAVVLIYLVMSALFESFLTPLSILTTIPLAYVGVYWSLYITNTHLDTIAFVGCILMVGIVVNNGIVIIDYITQLRRAGMNRYDAIVQAGQDRFRPVLMTALTTILGALPLAIGGGSTEMAMPSLGRALIGGLTTGTVLTLVVVPLFYSLIDDFQKWFLEFAGSALRIAGLRTARAAQ